MEAKMQITQAKQFLGKVVKITYTDRSGNQLIKITHVHDVAYVPSYGACLIGDAEDIWLDKVTEISEAA
jgi:hypothetical protein